MKRVSTVPERIAILELKVHQLGEELAKHAEETRREAATLGTKLDGLLVLKNKGMGAFWLASIIFGSSIVGALAVAIGWIKSWG